MAYWYRIFIAIPPHTYAALYPIAVRLVTEIIARVLSASAGMVMLPWLLLAV